MHKRLAVLVLLVLSLAPAVLARVISYAPYTDRIAVPAYQARETRHFALMEGTSKGDFPLESGQVVLYDSRGEQEPRVVYPQDGTSGVPLRSVSLFQNGDTAPLLLVLLQNSAVFSADGGVTWKTVENLTPGDRSWPVEVDTGGPFTRGLAAPQLIGNAEWPFILTASNGVVTVSRTGVVRPLIEGPPSQQLHLVGRDRTGTRVMVRTNEQTIVTVNVLNGAQTPLASSLDRFARYYGWLTADGGAYLLRVRGEGRFLYRVSGTPQFVAGPYFPPEPNFGGSPIFYYDLMRFFAVPTDDYEGAWIIQREPGKPTTLSLHGSADGLKTMWTDVTGPEVEALHTGTNKLLVQVHRPRAQAERWFLDPALAIWNIGEPAPRAYDELFLNEGTMKGFVNLDVDRYATGEPFVFDSAWQDLGGPGPIISPPVTPPPAGGGDVAQEWGVVRASTKQRLVLPGVARLPGAFASYWLTDVVIHNPANAPQKVDLSFVSLGAPVSAESTQRVTLTLAANEIRVMNDVLKGVFGLEQAGGAIFIEPEGGVSVTSRTYTRAAQGTYGFSMQALDVFTANTARFAASFAGAFPGANFRTNLILTDTAGRGTQASLQAHGGFGTVGASGVSIAAQSVVTQVNGIEGMLGLGSSENGGLVVQPMRGSSIPTLVAIDNRTNDPTYFPPDLPAPVVRTIPVIGHLDGANGAKFRSDLYLLNLANRPSTVTLEATSWDGLRRASVPFTLLPREARMIPDVLFKLFGMTGTARLRYRSDLDDGVRVTSRTYTLDETTGATYGSLIPPLNNFQSAATGESLEILIPAGPGFRTNIGLVELTQWGTGNTTALVEVFDDKGAKVDSFTLTVPMTGGTQVNDIFGARGLPTPNAARIRISPTLGLVGAYATVTDNITNDTAYVGANLAATP